jgi:hypothetical protein
LQKAEKSQIFDVLLTGPRDPRYGSDFIQKRTKWILTNVTGVFFTQNRKVLQIIEFCFKNVNLKIVLAVPSTIEEAIKLRAK